jgi:glycosyltransferase involved in cell wall biosynthesis
MSEILLTTVTPVYRGARCLGELAAQLSRLRMALEEAGSPVRLEEAIFVDDGSSDGSARVLAELADERPWMRVLTLSRNFGQHPATAAGILHSSGDWVATLDEDLQHRPDLLPTMLLHAARGSHDVVYAKPLGPVHDAFARDLSSRLTKRLLGWVAGNPAVASFNSFRMLRGSVARAAAAVSRQETYFDVALCWFSDRVALLELPLHDDRGRGESGYSLPTLLGHARRLLVSSQIRPLRLGVVTGGAAMLLSLAAAVAVVAQRLFSPETIDLPGWASLVVLILFFGGLVSLLLGMALEYLSGLYQQELGKPAFFVVDRSTDARVAALDDRLAPPAPGP